LPAQSEALLLSLHGPVKVRDLGRLPIRGRTDGIDVVGLDIPAAQAA